MIEKISIKRTKTEWLYFEQWLRECVVHGAKTNDALREYYLAYHALQVAEKLAEKQFSARHKHKQKTLIAQLPAAHLPALLVYFERYQLHNFLLPLQTEILSRIPEPINNLFRTNITHEKTIFKMLNIPCQGRNDADTNTGLSDREVPGPGGIHNTEPTAENQEEEEFFRVMCESVTETQTLEKNSTNGSDGD